jgi:hypothetical protein
MLIERKKEGKLTALDRRIIVKIQSLVEANPRHYNSMIGYLQLLYGEMKLTP